MSATRCLWPYRSSMAEVSNGRSGPNQSSGMLGFGLGRVNKLTSSRTYMFDGIYQSVICFFIPYLVFQPGLFVTSNGLEINDTTRMGVYVGNAAIVIVNIFILLNTYRWDWLMLVLVSLSILLMWFWTGVYSSFTSSGYFFGAGTQVYGQLSFWTTILLTASIALLPRFTIKASQKIYRPLGVDIVREQIRQGKFKYLDNISPDEPASKFAPDKSSGSSDVNGTGISKPQLAQDDETRPIYPPSVAPTTTTTTHNRGSANGSDSTNCTNNRFSLDRPSRPMSMTEPQSRPLSLSRPLSMDRPRPSFDRARGSMDMVRASFEASNDFTSARRLMRLESSHSEGPSARTPCGPSNLR